MAFFTHTSVNGENQCVNVPWSICSILSQYALFFPFTFITWHFCRDLLRYRQALGSNTLKSKSACHPLSQKLRARTSSLASLDLFVVRLLRSFPLYGTGFGSTLVLLHTSDNILAVRSYKSLCLMVTKLPFLQLLLCCISNLLPLPLPNFEISQPYLKLAECQSFCFYNSKPYSAMGNMVSQLDTPFSLLSCNNLLDLLSLRCSMTFLYLFSFSFLISNLMF